jgi:murein DD-endopeptidase MepM/ murein hydrolase activator NlpD
MKEYALPFPKDVKFNEIRPKIHKRFPETMHAVDFLVDVGTPVLALQGGTVVKVKSDSERYFHPDELKNLEDSEIRKLAEECINYVCISHDDGTYAEYAHLGKDRISVREGQYVGQGDVIGYTGLSGIMSEPHLHVNVFDKNGKSILIKLRI